MNFTFQPSEENDMIHYAQGFQKQGAKYIKRELKNGKWKYYYNVPKNINKVKNVENTKNKQNVNNTQNNKARTWDGVLFPEMQKLFQNEPELLNKQNYPNEVAWGNAVISKVGQILQQHKDLFDPTKYSQAEINEMRTKTMSYFGKILNGTASGVSGIRVEKKSGTGSKIKKVNIEKKSNNNSSSDALSRLRKEEKERQRREAAKQKANNLSRVKRVK